MKCFRPAYRFLVHLLFGKLITFISLCHSLNRYSPHLAVLENLQAQSWLSVQVAQSLLFPGNLQSDIFRLFAISGLCSVRLSK